jgi:hypothetical protein
MRHFTLRSKCKLDVQWARTRFALVHYIGKIHSFQALTTCPTALGLKYPGAPSDNQAFSTVSLGFCHIDFLFGITKSNDG